MNLYQIFLEGHPQVWSLPQVACLCVLISKTNTCGIKPKALTIIILGKETTNNDTFFIKCSVLWLLLQFLIC